MFQAAFSTSFWSLKKSDPVGHINAFLVAIDQIAAESGDASSVIWEVYCLLSQLFDMAAE